MSDAAPRATTPEEIAVGAAVNDRAMLDRCLARSPDIAGGRLPLSIHEGYRSAAAAYNAALAATTHPYLVMAHQDVYLPSGTAARLAAAIDAVAARDPDWAVLGVIGLDAAGRLAGQTWSSGRKELIGTRDDLPRRAVTLDELLLVLRTDNGLAFDPALPSFHLYAADIVEIARAAGRGAWVIDLPVVHNSRPVLNLGGGYSAAWRYLQAKYADRLPLPNLVCTVDRSSWPLRKRDLKMRLRNWTRASRGEAGADPAEIARQLSWESDTGTTTSV